MRLNLRLTPNSEPVPFDHVHNLTGAIHGWLGDNDLHDKISLYSFGWLNGSNAKNGSLHFPDGATWRISFWEEEYTEKLVDGIMDDPQIMKGMRVYEINEQVPPSFGDRYRFDVDSPVLARRNRDDGTRKHLLWKDEGVDQILTRTLRHKMKEAGIVEEETEINVSFDTEFEEAKSKLVTIKETSHRASVCPVIVVGSEKAVQFAWCVGVGELTGSGFGALK